MIQSQKVEIRLYCRRIDNIGVAANGSLTRGDVVNEELEVNMEQGTIDNLDIHSKEKD